MKISKILMALLASTMLFGAVSCSNNDDDNNTVPPTAGTTTVTKGTVSDNAVTTENGTKVATLTSDAGTYKFTETTAISSNLVARTADSSASGTWTFTESGKTNPKYSGTYTGDISSITSDAGTTLNLKVTKVASSDGTLVEVKTEQTFDFKASKTEGFTATIPAVTVKTIASGSLPASIGNNEVNGLSLSEGEGSNRLTFGSTEVTMIMSKNNSTTTRVYDYSWNATKKLVYLKLKSAIYEMGEQSFTCNSATEEVQAYSTYAQVSGDKLLAMTAEANLTWSTLMIMKYTVTEGNVTLGSSYFDPDYFPASTEKFDYNSDNYDFYVGFSKDGVIQIELSGADSSSWTTYRIYPEYKDGNFTATLFEKTDGGPTGDATYSRKGTVKGTYAIDGEDEDAKITITFTEVPAGFDNLKTSFVLESDNYN